MVHSSQHRFCISFLFIRFVIFQTYIFIFAETQIELYETIAEGTDVIVDGEVVFDPTETSYDILNMSSTTSNSSNSYNTFTPSSSLGSPEVDISETERETDMDVPVSPLLKLDLKNKIKLRRMAQGKHNIDVLFEQPEPERVSNFQMYI